MEARRVDINLRKAGDLPYEWADAFKAGTLEIVAGEGRALDAALEVFIIIKMGARGASNPLKSSRNSSKVRMDRSRNMLQKFGGRRAGKSC